MMTARLYFPLIVLCCITRYIHTQNTDDPHVNLVISLGHGQQLRGLNTTSSSDDTVYKFLGIPYAVPPLGDRRFQPPEPAPDWTGVKDAITRSSICLQRTDYDQSTSARSEDCLYLNVFSPDVGASLPVFVWIHGGGYHSGSAFNDGDGATLAPHGVVAVTINYRLGAFGFMSTGDEIMPGNYGMLDQILALKWVQKYIRAFGGDPSQVTIGGESAGAHSVSMLILSPLAKGLFHRAIMESGSALGLTALERPGVKLQIPETTLRSAVRVGCNQTTSSEILQCLQKVDANTLLNASRDVATTPRIETTFGFLPDEPITLLRDGNYNKVDTLHGTNSGEFSFMAQDPENDGVTKEQFRNIIRILTDRFINADAITSLVTDAYTANVTNPLIIRENLVHALADVNFGGATMVEIEKYVRAANTTTTHFLYEFDYRISGTTTPAWEGVNHTGELPFIFYPDSRYSYLTADDKAVGQAAQAMWVNFITHGEPTPSDSTITLGSGSTPVTWREFTENNRNMLKIDVPSKLVTYPRLFLIPLFETILEIMKSDVESTIIG